MTVRSVVSPKSVVRTMTVTEHWPLVAPLGIVVANVALPVFEVVSVDDVIAGTPGTARVKVT
jgi:hypothetical protein